MENKTKTHPYVVVLGMAAATHGARAGFCVCALASVLVEQTGGYSRQACERAAV